MQGARSAETGMYREYMRISSTAQCPVGNAIGEPSAAIFKLLTLEPIESGSRFSAAGRAWKV
jgi:hypothetical protein